MMRCSVPFAFVLLASSVIAIGQERTLTGKWAVKAEAVEGVSDAGGSWSRAAINGTLDITQSDDGILNGTWTRAAGEPWKLTGEVRGETFDIRTEVRPIPVIKDGEKRTAAMRWTFHGSVAGTTMTGTMTFDADENSERRQPFTALRQR